MQVQTNSNHTGNNINLESLLRILWRGKLLIILTTIFTISLGGYYAYVGAPKVYTSVADIVLEDKKNQVVDIESVMTGVSSDLSAINTEIQVLKSRGLIEKLVVSLNLLEDPEFNFHIHSSDGFSIGSVPRFFIRTIASVFGSEPAKERVPSEREILNSVIDSTIQHISISNIRNSYVFKIHVKTNDPEKSEEMANTLAKLYIQDQLDVKTSTTESATAWLSERVNELQVELETSETTVKTFLSQTDLISPEALTLLNKQLKDLRERLSRANEHQIIIKSSLDSLELIISSDNAIELAMQSKDDAIVQLAKTKQNASASNTETFKLRLQQIIDRKTSESQRTVNQVVSLTKSMSELEARITSQSNDLVKLQQLQREAQASKLIYEFFLSRLKETSAQQGILQSDSRILSHAVARYSPSSPKKPIMIAMSVLLGALIGSILVLLREMTQNTFRSAEELEAFTGYNVMGQIPSIPAKARKKILQYLTDKPTSAAAEAVRNLRTSIVMSNIDTPPKVIMSTSSIPGEGKTTQSLALTQNLSGLGKKVLLIEGDVRKRIFSEYFDIKEKNGLISILSGEYKIDDVVMYNDTLKADILIGEKSSVNAADLFSSEKFHSLINDLRKLYDFIIIDTPPVLVVPDARVIGQSVDAIIYSVKWDSTSQWQVRQGLKLLEDVGSKVSGLVLAQISGRGMKRYGYGKSYGADYGYYEN